MYAQKKVWKDIHQHEQGYGWVFGLDTIACVFLSMLFGEHTSITFIIRKKTHSLFFWLVLFLFPKLPLKSFI